MAWLSYAVNLFRAAAIIAAYNKDDPDMCVFSLA